jgi:hypothetical protein
MANRSLHILKRQLEGEYTGLSDDAINALVVHEQSENQKAVQAKITLPIVQVTTQHLIIN